jgi:HlyD family secretion protein
LARIKQGPSERQLAAAQASLSAAEANYAKLLSGPTEEALNRARLAIDQAKNSLWGAQNSRDSLGLAIQFGGSRSQYDQAQAQVLNAEIAVQLAEMSYRELQKGSDQGQLDAARAQLEQAKESYQALKESPRLSDLALAESQLAQAEASLSRARNGASSEEIRIAEGQVKQAQASLEQAQLLLDGAAIRAPFDGIIGVVNGEEGALVSVAAPFISLVNVSAFRIEVNVDEVDIVAIREGQPMLLILDALPEQKIRGRVNAISPLPTTDAGIVSYAVAIEIEPTDAPLRVGMSATAEITTQSKEDALLIPNRAIRIDRENGVFHVEKLVNGQPVDVEVTLGVRNEFDSEIVKGLEQGDQVIIRSRSLREQLSSSFMTQ